VNFAGDVLDKLPADGLALMELARDGARREWTFGEMAERSACLAGSLRARGIDRGDVVMTLIGNRPEWAIAMCACFRIGVVVLPCTEQLRAKDLGLRIDVARPSLILADERNRAELEEAKPGCEVLLVPDETLFDADPAPAVELDESEPCLITFTSGTSGEPRAVLHAQRYLPGQRLQATRWLGAKPGELVWCTASSGWSKSARNVFIAPWLSGASALLHDARFDPVERLDFVERERVNVLCMAPTEYRVIAARTTLRPLPCLRTMVAAGEALNPEILEAWREATGLIIRDGYGQTETGQMTGMACDEPARPGSMGKALPGISLAVLADADAGGAPDEHESVGDRKLGAAAGKPEADGTPGAADEPGAAHELVADPKTVPTFFLGYIGEDAIRDEDGAWRIGDRREAGPWRTGDRVREDDDGYLWFEGRDDDVIVSAGYRIGPFEVESALVSHPAVAEAAAIAAPDRERGAVVRAVVVLRDGHDPSPGLAKELQDHVKRETAPYKYPRIVDFASELPKTASGKIKRAELRER
jgi:acyl-coenzyme A synthetase/AMP-(fatty) acid ligase